MQNPRTTLAGYVAIGLAALMLVKTFLAGGTVTLDQILAIGSMVAAGTGGVMAKDGGR